ncbi:MAG: tetratricopeptide repeat-containing glycosyltransferase family protein [Planctomycetota bacterium]
MPTLTEALSQAWAVHQSGNVDAAMQMYRGVLRQAPKSAEAWVYLGIAQFDLNDFASAASSYRHGLQLKPKFPIGWNNLGNALRMLGDVEEADTCFETALQQRPDYLSAIKNRGTLWIWSGDIQRGLRWYEQGLQIDPDHAELHRNLGVIYLLTGDFQRGFDEYRWRWKMPGVARPDMCRSAPHRSESRVPLWAGQPLRGKTILLYPEQGLGDAIQFLRVAQACHDDGARVVVVCDAGLIPLFSSMNCLHQLLPDLPASQPPAVDFQGSFIEVLDTWYVHRGELVHGSGHGYLDVSPSLVAYWQRQLGSIGQGRRRVGLNWQGNPEHHADVYRSVPLARLEALAQLTDIELVSVQFGPGTEQLETVGFSQRITRLPSGLDTTGGKFMDTGAILKNLDAVVTTDTSLAHLAGSLGVRTELILGRVPDWRWGLEGDSTPWYAGMRLHRQAKLGDWTDVIESVVASLQPKGEQSL